MKSTDLLASFYGVISELAERFGVHRLGDCTGQMSWPDRGVYFFLDPDEPRGASRFRGEGADPESGSLPTLPLPRVVRVGTHALKPGASSTLWKRLHQHRGQSTGTGNHRGSVFRRHVGRALLARDGVAHPTWGVRSSASREVRMQEAELEMRVSEYLGRLLVVHVPVLDPPGPQSRRAYVERNAIALLSREGRRSDPPTPAWLGHYAPSAAISGSGLWNVAHVGELVDEGFVEVFRQLASAGVSSGSRATEPPNRPAPSDPPRANSSRSSSLVEPNAVGGEPPPLVDTETATLARQSGITHPRGLSTSAQVLYWYMHAVATRVVPVARAAWESGLSERDVYKAIRAYPETWTLDGLNVRWTRATRGGRAHRLAQRHGSKRGDT